MKIDKIFLCLLLSIFVLLTYGCEKSSDQRGKQEDGQVGRDEVERVKTLTGTWHLTSSDGDSGPLEVRQFGKNIVGTFRGTNNPHNLFAVSGTLSGEAISLEFSQGSDVIAKYEGKVTGNTMRGRWVYEDQSGTWEAIRE